MNRLMVGICAGVCAMLWMTGAGWAAAPKLGVLDVARLIKAHPEAREADALLKKQAEEFENEQKTLIGGLEKMKKEFDAVRDEAADKALSDTARQQKLRIVEQKYTDLREQEKVVREKLLLRQQQLNDMRRKMRDGIEDKIREAAAKYSRDNGYTLLLDRSGRGDGRSTEIVVFAQDSLDVTEEVAKLLGIDKKELAKEEKKD